jgi:hypothetical protein
MKIENLKDLKKVIDLCRSTGVDKMSIDGIHIELGLAPIKQSRRSKSTEFVQSEGQTTTAFTPGGIREETTIPILEALTEEQLLFYSVNSESVNTQQLS